MGVLVRQIMMLCHGNLGLYAASNELAGTDILLTSFRGRRPTDRLTGFEVDKHWHLSGHLR